MYSFANRVGVMLPPCGPGSPRVQYLFRSESYESGITTVHNAFIGAPLNREGYHVGMSDSPPPADLDLRLVRYFTVVPENLLVHT